MGNFWIVRDPGATRQRLRSIVDHFRYADYRYLCCVLLGLPITFMNICGWTLSISLRKRCSVGHEFQLPPCLRPYPAKRTLCISRG